MRSRETQVAHIHAGPSVHKGGVGRGHGDGAGPLSAAPMGERAQHNRPGGVKADCNRGVKFSEGGELEAGVNDMAMY